MAEKTPPPWQRRQSYLAARTRRLFWFFLLAAGLQIAIILMLDIAGPVPLEINGRTIALSFWRSPTETGQSEQATVNTNPKLTSQRPVPAEITENRPDPQVEQFASAAKRKPVEKPTRDQPVLRSKALSKHEASDRSVSSDGVAEQQPQTESKPKPDEALASAGQFDTEADQIQVRERIHYDLLAWIERHKRYPLAARRAGEQGSVLVRFTIDREGHLLHQDVLLSSGSAYLDAAAIKLLQEAAPYPGLPDSLLADRLEVSLPIEYRMHDDISDKGRTL